MVRCKVKDDLTGKTFGTSTVISWAGVRFYGAQRKQEYLVRCRCGSEFLAVAQNIKRGDSCYMCRNAAIKSARTTHGKSNTNTYSIWAGMIGRCEHSGHTSYPRYGALGVKVCKDWYDYEIFLVWMGERPSERHSLDRINPFGDYEPGNVRWATPEVQANNKKVHYRTKHATKSRQQTKNETQARQVSTHNA
jgi:hypothetical protein